MNRARTPQATPLWREFHRFIVLRRAEGLTYGTEYRNIRLLADHLHAQAIQDVRDVTKEALDSFFENRGHRKPGSFNGLLSTVRCLFEWLVLQDAIPTSPLKVEPRRVEGRRTPVIFMDDELKAMLAHAGQLKGRVQQPLRGELWRTLFAVLISLGLREMEGASVRIEDVDLKACTIFVRKGKFSKERLAPFGPKLAEYLRHFIGLRVNAGAAPSDYLFTFTGRKPVSATSIYRAFKTYLLPAVAPREEYRRARVHDLRHTFAVQTLISWYRAGIDPNEFLDDLSIYMGHASVASTSVYLTLTNEILGLASDRFEAYSAIVWKAVEAV